MTPDAEAIECGEPRRAATIELREGAREVARRDAAIALRSAIVLGASLACTWSVALLVRLLLPRWLGPDAFGGFTFADNFTATFFVVLGLGVETYIQKEIPVRPAHASDFFGGVVVVRVAMACLLLFALSVVAAATHRSPVVQHLVLVFGAGQLVLAINGSLAALLQASRVVSGLALVNVAAKVLWGVGVLAALVLDFGLVGIAWAFVLGELLRLVALASLARRQLGLALRVDLAAVRTAIAASLPYYVNAIACTIYARVDVTMLSLLTNDREVGWYAAAANFAALALLASPLVGWVLLPMFSRAAARSEEELLALLRRTIEATLLLALPLSLIVGLGADVWIRVVFGRAFAPAVASLRLLAPVFLFTYVAMLAATALVLRGRAWHVALLSIGGLVVNPTSNLLLVRFASRALGPGGAGVGAAVALLGTEMLVAAGMVALVGRGAFDRRSVRAIATAVVACLVVVPLDVVLRPLGAARLLLDLVVWSTLVLATRAVRLGELAPIVRLVFRARRTPCRS